MEAANPHIKRAHPVFHSLAILFGLIEGIITAVLVSDYNSNVYFDHLSSARFLVFVSWWTFVFSILFLVGGIAGLPFFGTIGAELAYIFVTWVFWVAGAGAITNHIGGTSCVGIIADCSTIKAAEAFAWIEFILFSLWLFALIFIGIMRHRSGGSGVWGGSLA